MAEPRGKGQRRKNLLPPVPTEKQRLDAVQKDHCRYDIDKKDQGQLKGGQGPAGPEEGQHVRKKWKGADKFNRAEEENSGGQFVFHVLIL